MEIAKTKWEEYLVRRISSNESYHDLLTFPRYIEIETVNVCNARCPMCTISTWERNSKPMTDELFLKISNELIKHNDVIKRVSLYRDGEPLIDNKLASRVSILKKGGIKEVAISTNVSLLNEKRATDLLNAGIDLVILSIDSIKKDVYESIRVGLKFENVFSNAIRFIELRNKIRPETRIWVRMIRQESNNDEWDDYYSFWKNKVTNNDRVYFHYIFNWGGQLKNFKPISISYEPNLPCVAIWSLFVIFSNGDVPLCNIDFNNKHPVGNVRDHSIEDIWKSKVITEKRYLHLNNRKGEIDICKNCNVWDEPKDGQNISSQYADEIELGK